MGPAEGPGTGRADGEARDGEDPFLARRLAMVRELRASGIRDPDVLAAFARVPRERFVPADLVTHAYDDSALGIGHGQTISQPYIVARMTELLELPAIRQRDPSRDPRALDVGTGSGYQAAILAAMGALVVSIERDPDLSALATTRLIEVGFGDRVRCVVGDGSAGWVAGAPYDAIVVGAAAPHVPEPLVAQLAEGARLVIPVGPRDYQSLHVVRRQGTRLEEQIFDACVFVPLIGQYGFPG
jgi:protein-L-isoaspartate(D-aspartate) O-methyltransferase